LTLILRIFFLTFCVGFVLAQNAAFAAMEADMASPPDIHELENIPKLHVIVEADAGLPFDIRLEAVREAALSYGARGGLAWRTFHIKRDLEAHGVYMDKVFDFRQLLIPAPSGLLIEPPIISETINSMIISGSGQEAAVADRVYNINRNARIVSTSRSWRNYLEREWGNVMPPPDILRPNNEGERARWIEWIHEGWEKGVNQANEIFEQDLNQLTAHYQGMVRYRMLLAQGMVSPPYALQVDRGVTGGGDKMLVGDRAVEITGKPELIPGTESWQPASR